MFLVPLDRGAKWAEVFWTDTKCRFLILIILLGGDPDSESQPQETPTEANGDITRTYGQFENFGSATPNRTTSVAHLPTLPLLIRRPRLCLCLPLLELQILWLAISGTGSAALKDELLRPLDTRVVLISPGSIIAV